MMKALTIALDLACWALVALAWHRAGWEVGAALAVSRLATAILAAQQERIASRQTTMLMLIETSARAGESLAKGVEVHINEHAEMHEKLRRAADSIDTLTASVAASSASWRRSH